MIIEIEESKALNKQFYFSEIFSVYRILYLIKKEKDKLQDLLQDSYCIIWSGSKKIVHEINTRQVEIPENHFIYLAPNTPQKFVEEQLHSGAYIFIFKYEFYAKNSAYGINLNNCFLFFEKEQLSSFKNNICNEIVFKHVFIFPIINGENDKYFSRLKHNILERIILNGKISLDEIEFDAKENDFDVLLASRFKELLEANVTKEHKVSFYENNLFVTKRTLDKATIKLYNKKAKRMIIDEILNQSKALLLHTNMQVKEIALKMGFLQETNFTAFFKKYAVVSPKKFKEANKF